MFLAYQKTIRKPISRWQFSKWLVINTCLCVALFNTDCTWLRLSPWRSVLIWILTSCAMLLLGPHLQLFQAVQAQAHSQHGWLWQESVEVSWLFGMHVYSWIFMLRNWMTVPNGPLISVFLVKHFACWFSGLYSPTLHCRALVFPILPIHSILLG